MWGQTQPTIFTLWLRQGHRVHTYPHGKTLPSGHSQTQGPGHTVSNRQQLASVLGTPVMKDGPLRVLSPSTGIQNCTGHGAGLLWFLALSWPISQSCAGLLLFSALCWPCFSVLSWPSVVLSPVLVLCGSQLLLLLLLPLPPPPLPLLLKVG